MNKEQLKDMVRIAQRNKQELRDKEYHIGFDTYYVTGIGPESIKAYKNEELQPKFFRYFQREGENLLVSLVNSLAQSRLL